ncbi:MAG: Eco57I restriction-modification methylase domain-containing protein [Caldisphaera sp.]
MEVQEIVEGKNKVIDFLKEKGFFQEKEYYDDDYKEGTYFKIDKRKLLVVYEASDEERINEIKNHFLIDRGLSYCIIVFDKKLLFFRNFGETKYFIYSERTKENIFKKDMLSRINENFDNIFQTEDNSGKFYEAFKLKRNILAQSIKNNVDPVQKYLISQKIFDRFFFIYFICHKGIIKFKDGRKLSGENLFSNILLKNGNFIQNLKEIFRLFNSQEENSFEIGSYKIVIPYLNGGLFRPDVLEQDLNISLKNEQWEDIFQFLNSYHWIIEDIKAIEETEEKILTPEILGHVYERSVVEWEREGFEKEAENAINKITERKKKGVYYTPEPITDYISNNTIIPYLLQKLNKKYNSFEELIRSRNEKDMKDAIKILDEIKVLDPACGSGAFLIKAAEIIFALKRRLNYELKEKKNFYDLKLNIITENIYGVDILSGAIEISKLRLWLWLISDYEESKNEIKALPNIEYNLKIGNSLVGWLSERFGQTPISTPLNDKVDEILTGLIASSEGDDGESLKKTRELLRGYKSEGYIEAYYILYTIYRRTHGLKAENLRSILEIIQKSIYATVTPIFLNYINNKIKLNHNKKTLPITKEQLDQLNVFHWRIDFGYIMLNGGFDVVIGNPPYLSNKRISKVEKIIFKKFYKGVTGVMNTFVLFIERSGYVSHQKSMIGLIVPKNIIRSPYYSLMRKYMLDNFSLNEIIDVGPGAFQFVTGETIIFIIKNINFLDNEIKITTNFFEKKFFSAADFKITYLKQQIFLKQEGYNFNIYLDEKKLDVKNKILKNSDTPLSNLCEVKTCIATGDDDKYVTNKKLNRKYKKTLRGKDINRYQINYANLYVLYDPEVLHRSREERIFLEPEKTIIRTVSSEIIATYDNENFYPLSTCIALIPRNGTNMKFITSLLNSKLITFYYDMVFNLGAHLTTEISVDNIERIPVKVPNNQATLTEIVDKIMILTKSHDYLENKEKQNKVKELQEEIDTFVYKLYKMTSDEIKIIEDFCKE